MTPDEFLEILRDSDYSTEALLHLARAFGAEADANWTLRSLQQADQRLYSQLPVLSGLAPTVRT